jgi:hypothetical protein
MCNETDKVKEGVYVCKACRHSFSDEEAIVQNNPVEEYLVLTYNDKGRVSFPGSFNYIKTANIFRDIDQFEDLLAVMRMGDLKAFMDWYQDHVEDDDDTAIQSSKRFMITQFGNPVYKIPFENHEDAVDALRVFIQDNFDVAIEKWEE